MITTRTRTNSRKTGEAIVKFPLSALRYVSVSPKRNKITVEIAIEDIRRINTAKTLDEIINEARLDYATGNFTTHKTAKSLIAELDA